jgi:hypothetical protein
MSIIGTTQRDVDWQPYHKGAAAIDDLRQRFAARLGQQPWQPAPRAVTLAALGGAYRTLAGQAVTTPMLVEAIRKAAPAAVAEAGVGIDPAALEALLDGWESRWFGPDS